MESPSRSCKRACGFYELLVSNYALKIKSIQAQRIMFFHTAKMRWPAIEVLRRFAFLVPLGCEQTDMNAKLKQENALSMVR